jgi:hypothetical protein
MSIVTLLFLGGFVFVFSRTVELLFEWFKTKETQAKSSRHAIKFRFAVTHGGGFVINTRPTSPPQQ